MPKVKISEFSSTPASNTDIDGINIAEGCAPSGINDAIRELMAQLKDFQTGAVGDSFNGPVGTSTAAAGAFTTLSATGVTTVQAGSAGAPAITTSGDTNTGIFFPAADTIAFAEGGAEIARFDSSGNLGLGVTPSASWFSGSRVFQLGGSSAFWTNGSNNTAISQNAVFGNSSFTYILTGIPASYYRQLDGAHNWFTAPSGTAGNAISFTQAMTLDSSGRLGIGTTSASAALAVSANGGTDVAVMSGIAGAAYFGAVGAKPIVFESNGAERARIDSSGNLLVGKTADVLANTGVLLDARGSFTFTRSGAPVGYVNRLASDGEAIVFMRSTSQVGSISVTTTATSYVTSSDYRLKNTIAPITGALAKVALLKPCTYKWNADGSDGEGFIAHELAEIVPQCVTGEKDAVDAEGNPKYQGIDTSFLVATLTAAIQEQQALIQTLTARVAALESN
jgi:hypothetical protein